MGASFRLRVLSAAVLFAAAPASAQIRTDGSLSPARALAGPNYAITESLGRRVGGNLFHSFQIFSVGAGETATFSTVTPTIANVIGRVTGGEVSTINGALRLQATTGTPALYLINPAGITFGPGASIDVPGAFHVSTADSLKFPDGRLFVDPGRSSTFSAAPPEAFGFFGQGGGKVDLQGANLRLPVEFNVTAGEISIEQSQVRVPSGALRLVATGQMAGDVPLASSPMSAVAGGLTIAGSALDTSGDGAGIILIHAGEVMVRGASTLFADNTGDTNASSDRGIRIAVGKLSVAEGSLITADVLAAGSAGQIAVDVTGAMSLLSGGMLGSRTLAAGKAGTVKVNAGSLGIDGQGNPLFTGISSKAESGSSGDAGALDITVGGAMSIVNGGQISSSTSAAGNAGKLRVNAGSLEIDGRGERYFTGIGSEADSGSTGDAGTLDITVGRAMSIVNAGRVSSNTWSIGNAGTVRVNAGSLGIDNQGSRETTGIVSEAIAGSSGNAGALDIAVTGEMIVTGGEVSTSTWAAGNAGALKVNAGSLSIDHKVGDRFTGIVSTAKFSSSGDAGAIDITVGGKMAVSGGEVSSSTFSVGHGGTVKVSAGSLRIDGHRNADFGGITSNADFGSEGDAGALDITVDGLLSIVYGGQISSDTSASGNAGKVKVNAGSLVIDGQGSPFFTGIGSKAEWGFSSFGHAGTVDITVGGALSIVDGGQISSGTSASGNAGKVKVNAGSLVIDGQGSSSFTGIGSKAERGSFGDAGAVDITVGGALSIVNGGQISSGTSAGKAGTVAVNAGSLGIDGQKSPRSTGIDSDAHAGSSGGAGALDITVGGALSIVNGGVVSSSTWAAGNAGAVRVNAGSLGIDGQGSSFFTGLVSSAESDSSGNAGALDITVGGALSIVNGGQISSGTVSSGKAGTVTVNAGSLVIDGQGWPKVTGIGSDAHAGSSGDAGALDITVGGALSIVNGGTISSSTWGAGNAGAVRVNAGSFRIDGQGSLMLTGLVSNTEPESSGDAGALDITVGGALSIVSGGEVASSTWGLGKAGTVKVNAGSLDIDGRGSPKFTGIGGNAYPGSSGDAGAVDVTVGGALAIVDGGAISSAIWAAGNAGTVKVNAGSLSIDARANHSMLTGIATDAISGSSGDAGALDIAVGGTLSIVNGGALTSNTSAAGKAGALTVVAATIVVDGAFDGIPSRISASAGAASAGQTGSVIVTATDGITLADGGLIATRNRASVSDPALLTPTFLTVTAPRLTMKNASISSASTGNVAASNINVIAGESLHLASSMITTSANEGNGGAIVIEGGSLLRLDNATISTSVAGTRGNGGDIAVTARALALNTGFIQANTAARGSAGGDVSIRVESLLPSHGSQILGGDVILEPQYGIPGYNLIQAAAPDGVSGNIAVTSPQLDLAGSLVGLTANAIPAGRLGRSPCHAGGGSSLSLTGRGGLPPGGAQPVGVGRLPPAASGSAAAAQMLVAAALPCTPPPRSDRTAAR